jgi:branched-chain amino acid aminotransferase
VTGHAQQDGSLSLMAAFCSVDGVLVPETEAVVPVLDRGFLFADSVYEVLRTRQGLPFAWLAHLERLRRSAGAIAMPIQASDHDLLAEILRTLRASGAGPGSERYVRLIVTRGTGTAPGIDLSLAQGPQRIVILVRDLPTDRARRPCRAALVRRTAGVDPTIKSGSYLPNVLGLAEARRLGAEECLFVDEAGMVSEASTANVHMVAGGQLHTPPLDSGILAGVTRTLLLEAAKEAGIPVVERPLPADDIRSAEEVLLTGSVREIAPVTHVDGVAVGSDRPGPVTALLTRAFDDACERQAARDQLGITALGLA